MVTMRFQKNYASEKTYDANFYDEAFKANFQTDFFNRYIFLNSSLRIYFTTHTDSRYNYKLSKQ